MKTVIRVIPPGGNLLQHLAREILDGYPSGRRHLVTVVFPSRRAGLFFREYLKRLNGAGPLDLPRIYAVRDLFLELSARLEPRRLLPPLDQAWILWDICRQRRPFFRLAETFDRFLPWGLRLAEVFEELDRELVEARNLLYPPEDLPAEARTLLEHLGDIKALYEKRLDQEGLSTEARALRLLAERSRELSFPAGPLYLAGFFALTRAEEKLFSYWLSQGAKLYWEDNPAELQPILRRQLKTFRASLEVIELPEKASPRVTFHEAPDLHHELAALEELIPSQISNPEEVVIILGSLGGLIPLLHSLPEALPVNITLGYPLHRTALGTLLRLLVALQERRHKGRYHVPDYLRLLKHPYIKSLSFAGKKMWSLFHLLEQQLRYRGSPYLALKDIESLFSLQGDVDLSWEDFEPTEAAEAVARFHQWIISPWEAIETTRDLARVVRETIVWTTQRVDLARSPSEPLSRGPEVFWASRPEELLERAFVAGVERELLPLLESAFFAREPLRPKTLFRLLKEVLLHLRAPFEGHPLKGLQVMGLLESRLLCFEKVIVLDANEGDLPSAGEINPLLPEAVRPALGLPPRQREEEIEAYHFRRLIQAAKEAHLFYQSAVSAASFLGKKVRSRFVEQLLWEQEKVAGQMLTAKIRTSPLNLEPAVLRRPEFQGKGRAEKEAVEALFNREAVSATMLNTYLTCPVKFYFRYVVGLAPGQEVAQYDATEMGNLIHQALENYFSSFKGRLYQPQKDNNPQELKSIFRKLFEKSSLAQRLGAERRFFVLETALFRLQRYLEFLKRKGPFEILDVEKTLDRKIHGYRFTGRLDRLDRCQDQLIVVDYKTGAYLPAITQQAKEQLLVFSPPRSLEAAGWRQLRQCLPDIQLFLYLYLCDDLERDKNAVFIHLAAGREDNLEQPLFRERDFSIGLAHRLMKEAFPRALIYLLEHILEAPAFYATEEAEYCRFCDFRLACLCARV